MRFDERGYVKTHENPRCAEKRPGNDLNVPPLIPYSPSKPSAIKRERRRKEEKSGVLAFMSQDTRERPFGVVTRERISIAVRPYSHKIEQLDGKLESAIGALRADVRGLFFIGL